MCSCLAIPGFKTLLMQSYLIVFMTMLRGLASTTGAFKVSLTDPGDWKLVFVGAGY